jgi:hypothetical protein
MPDEPWKQYKPDNDPPDEPFEPIPLEPDASSSPPRPEDPPAFGMSPEPSPTVHGPMVPGPPHIPPVMPQQPYMGSHFRPHRGGMLLAFGIVGLVVNLMSCGCCVLFVPVGLVFSIMAWMMGRSDLQAMQRGEIDPAGQGSTNAGVVLGIIGVVLGGLAIVFTILSIVLNLGMSGMGGGPGNWP